MDCVTNAEKKPMSIIRPAQNAEKKPEYILICDIKREINKLPYESKKAWTKHVCIHGYPDKFCPYPPRKCGFARTGKIVKFRGMLFYRLKCKTLYFWCKKSRN